MLFKKEIENQIFALFFIALGGWLLHLKSHPISGNPANYIPFIFGLLSVLAVPFLVNYKKTFLLGYLVNGFSVIIGMLVMAKFSLTGLPSPLTFSRIFLFTTFPFILILLSKLLIAQSILKFYHPSGLGRMFTAWWWARHFVYLTGVFALGHVLWK